MNGLSLVPAPSTELARKDFISSQEVKWCPGCGDYTILAAVQGLLPQLGIARENTVVLSGIGCSGRFPYYVGTYGMHSIHGRALTIATGLTITRPDLAVMVVTGDGDALSIGGNHFIHTMRRNPNITVLMFNNRIYGLTKGQYSPTSELGKITKSSPTGTVDTPLNPLSLALGAEASFVARTTDSDKTHLTETIRAAFAHRGASFVEIYQNCSIFNDGAYDSLHAEDAEGFLLLEHNRPILSASGRLGVVRASDGELVVAPVDEVGMESVLVHDAHRLDPTLAFGLSRLTDTGIIRRAPIGVLRQVDRPSFDDMARAQVDTAMSNNGASTDESIQRLLTGEDTWQVH